MFSCFQEVGSPSFLLLLTGGREALLEGGQLRGAEMPSRIQKRGSVRRIDVCWCILMIHLIFFLNQ